MKLPRVPALMGVLLLLAGCAQIGGERSMFDQTCLTPDSSNAGLLAAVDWDSARKINLRIRQDTFVPTYIGISQDTPYRLIIENADDRRHVFRAMEFFKSIAVADVRVISGPGAGVVRGYSCAGAISVAAGGTTEARFVSIRDGVYEFDNNPVLLSFVLTGSAGGFIVVERKRVIPESPVKHLKILQRAPLITTPVSVPVVDNPWAMTEPKPEPETSIFDDDEDSQMEQAPAADLFSD